MYIAFDTCCFYNHHLYQPTISARAIPATCRNGAVIGTLLFDLAKNRLSMNTFACVVLFTLLHVVGARYIYSYVPYKEWSVSAGIVGADFFQDPRNHYDRLVHLAFGLLMFPYFRHLSKEWLKLNIPTAILMSWLIVQAGSMIYELFEWLITVFLSSEEADC